MRCDGCKHWNQDQDFAAGLGECTRAHPFWELSTWKDDDDGYRRVLLPAAANDKMFVQDGSDYRAHLITTPDFFCAHFEPGTFQQTEAKPKP
jgi:hypothetical protein